MRRFPSYDEGSSNVDFPPDYKTSNPSLILEYPLYLWQVYESVGFDQAPKPITILVTSTDVYIHHGGSWSVGTPIYDTGSATWSSGSTSVTGSGTTWNTHLIDNGNNHFFKAGSQYLPIATVNSNTSLTLGTAPDNSGSSASYEIRRCFGSSSSIVSDNHEGRRGIFAVVFNGELYIAGTFLGGFRGGPAIAKLGVRDSPAAPAEYIAGENVLAVGLDAWGSGVKEINGLDLLQDGRVIVAVQETSGAEARIRYSSHLDTSVWTTSPAGFTDDVSGGSGPALGIHRLGQVRTVHYQDGISIARLTGQDDPPLAFESTRSSEGAYFHRAVIHVSGRLFWLRRDGTVMTFSGSEVRSHTSAFRSLAVGESGSPPNNVFGANVASWAWSATYDPRRNEITFWGADEDGGGLALVVSPDDPEENRFEVYGATPFAVCPLLGEPGVSSSSSLAEITGEANATPSMGELMVAVGRLPSAASEPDFLWRIIERTDEEEAGALDSDNRLQLETHPDDFGASGQSIGTERLILVLSQDPQIDLAGSDSDSLIIERSPDGGVTWEAAQNSPISVSYSTNAEQVVHALFDEGETSHSWSFRVRTTDVSHFAGRVVDILVRYWIAHPLEAIA